MQLRPYQAQFLRDVQQCVTRGETKILGCAPTGSGKTIMMAQLCKDAIAARQQVLIVVHLDVLVGQTYDKLAKFGLGEVCGFIKAGWTENRSAAIQIASVQTLARRQWWQDWLADWVIYDEAHTTLFSSIGKTIRYRTHANAIALALTATPYRLSKQEGMGDHLEAIVSCPTPQELQELGHLASMKYYGLDEGDRVDLNGIRTVAGDFNEADLKNACDTPVLVQRIVEEWQRLTAGKRSIAFCVGVEHAYHVAAAFRDAGVPADTVTGETPLEERHRLYSALGKGEILMLTSVNVISIGFDEPSVEVGLLLRPTQSLALHHQQIGRVMRCSPQTQKTHGIILDQAGNCLRLGFPEDVERYELVSGGGGFTPGMGEMHKKRCPTCSTLLRAVVPICPCCQHSFAREQAQYMGDLVELRQLAEDQQRRAYRRALRSAFRLGQTPDQALAEWWRAFPHSEPEPDWSLGAIFGDQATENDFDAYWQHLQRLRRSHPQLTESGAIALMEQEFGEAVSLWLLEVLSRPESEAAEPPKRQFRKLRVSR
ncbi:MAG: DEAD/DEAH box helicase [Spirulina sp. SIO3F2]|nr:DEAD/DEAH box helicase [Spirulina sp. SIO3F2]